MSAKSRLRQQQRLSKTGATTIALYHTPNVERTTQKGDPLTVSELRKLLFLLEFKETHEPGTQMIVPPYHAFQIAINGPIWGVCILFPEHAFTSRKVNTFFYGKDTWKVKDFLVEQGLDLLSVDVAWAVIMEDRAKAMLVPVDGKL
jgi:hypothetical protein